MAKRHQVVEIFAPTLGIRSDAPKNNLDLRAQPDGQNFKTYYGANQKEYGTSLFNTGDTGVGAQPNLMFEARFPAGNSLQVLNATGVYKYTSGSDTFVSDGQTFSSTFTDFWRGVVHNDQFIYTNGGEDIQIKTSFSATGTVMNSAVTPTTYHAWDVHSIRDHLVLYHIFEDGTEHYKRVQWTKKGLLNPAGTDDFSTGTAGAIDLQDCEGEIKGASPLGPGVTAVLAERSIHLQFWVGGTEVYRFEKMISGVGTPSRRGFVSYEGVLYFLGNDNIYEYHGGQDLRPIGNGIKQKFYSELTEANIEQAWVEFDAREKELLVHIPTGTHANGETDTVYVYRLEDRSWARLKRNYTSSGRSTRTSALTIGELVGNIGAQNFTFGEASAKAQAEVRIYSDQSGRIVKQDKTVYSVSESGTSSPQNFTYQTPCISAAKAFDPADRDSVKFISRDKIWHQYNVELKGEGSGIIEYSVNRGNSFTPLPESPVTLVATGTLHQLDIIERSKEIMIQIRNTGTNEFIAVGYQKLEFVPGSEQGSETP